MIAYELAQLGLSGHSIEFSCTVPAEAKPALEDLRKRTGAKIHCIGWHDGDEVQWLVERCQGKEVYALWWLLRRLCVSGWEPYASHTDAAQGTRHLLRKASIPLPFKEVAPPDAVSSGVSRRSTPSLGGLDELRPL